MKSFLIIFGINMSGEDAEGDPPRTLEDTVCCEPRELKDIISEKKKCLEEILKKKQNNVTTVYIRQFLSIKFFR